jgi:hypothetical protein
VPRAYLLNNRPVTIIGKADQRGQVWVETADGMTLRVHRSGLSIQGQSRPVALRSLKVEDDRAFAPAIR